MLRKIISDAILLWAPIYFALQFPEGIASTYLGVLNILAWVVTVVMILHLKGLSEVTAARNYTGLPLFYVITFSIIEGVFLFQLGLNGLIAMYLITCTAILDYWVNHGKTSKT